MNGRFPDTSYVELAPPVNMETSWPWSPSSARSAGMGANASRTAAVRADRSAVFTRCPS